MGRAMGSFSCTTTHNANAKEIDEQRYDTMSNNRTAKHDPQQRPAARNDGGNSNKEPGFFGRLGQNIEKAKKGYEQLVHAIIRPPRASYKTEELGPADFTFLGVRFVRQDVELNTGRRDYSAVDDSNKNKTTATTTTATAAATSEQPPATLTEEEQQQQPRLLKLQASIWTRKDHPPGVKKTMVVYLHGNASARVEVLPSLSFLLSTGLYGVASLDFTGSGQSDGDYVSLGYYERHDLECLLQYLNETQTQTQTHGYGDDLEVVLWGRSMGASTALMHASLVLEQKLAATRLERINNNNDDDDDGVELGVGIGDDNGGAGDDATPIVDINIDHIPPTKGLICDSPFASLPQLCQELVERARQQGIVVPNIAVSVALALISRSVSHKARFSIHEIAPIQHVAVENMPPALFICGAEDDFIPPHHSEDLCEKYRRDVTTNLFRIPGQGHNDARPRLVYEAAAQYLQYRFSVELTPLQVPHHYRAKLHQHPPWAYNSQPHMFRVHKAAAAAETGGPAAAAPTTSTTSASEQAAELGMTQERQDDIQNKLHAMIGQGKS